MAHWVQISDFLHGPGYREDLSYQEDAKYIWMYDLYNLYHFHKDEELNEIYNKINHRFPYTDEELDAIYAKLEPLLEERRIRAIKYAKEHPTNGFKSITLPKINRVFPPLLL